MVLVTQGVLGSYVTLLTEFREPKHLWQWRWVAIMACGAICGFHVTQSPMMDRCLRREKDGRKVFYGAMPKTLVCSDVRYPGCFHVSRFFHLYPHG